MNRLKIAAGLAAVLAASLLLAPGSAAASCSDRKATGTVVGGVGGALIGNSISRGGGGAILGGLGGAVLGHEIARGTCGHERRAEYRRRYYRGYGPYPTGDRFSEAHPQPQPMIGYYDERGNLVGQIAGAVRAAAQAPG